jgi:hypothetical protein
LKKMWCVFYVYAKNNASVFIARLGRA